MSKEVRTIAVISAGATGRSIAHAAALSGYRTILEDILPASLRRAEDEIRERLDRDVELGTVGEEGAKAAFGRLEYATTLEDAAREADMVIEAVPEEFDSKEEIFRLLDRVCRPGTVLITNTSSLNVAEIAAVTERPQMIAGMRFVKSTHGFERIDVVRAPKTAEATLAAAYEAAKRMVKETSIVDESAGK